jgi:hypothetical protein
MNADLVQRLPLWLAPNVITVSGLLCIVLAYAVNALLLPNYVGALLAVLLLA